MDRYFIDAHGPDANAERTGVAWLAKKAARLGTSGAILVSDVPSIENLAGAIGAKAAALAQKERSFRLGGVRIEVFSDRTKPSTFDGPMLVPWATDKWVNEIEGLRPPAICAIPWGENDLAEWKQAWNPIDVRTGEPIGEDPPTVSSPLVEQALVSLTQTVNLSTGIHHPSDKRHATRFFKALYLSGERLDESEIRTWAISNGWMPRHAEDLAELAGKIAAGRSVRGSAMNKTEAKQITQRLRDLMACSSRLGE